jgi:hypothetical protein
MRRALPGGRWRDAGADAAVTLSSPETQQASWTIKPKELRRLRTGWREASSKVTVTVTNAQGLRFDNLAYVHP